MVPAIAGIVRDGARALRRGSTRLRDELPALAATLARRRCSTPALDQLLARLPGRGRSRAAGGATATLVARALDARAPAWRAPGRRARPRRAPARRLRLGVLPRRHVGPLLRALDHRPRPRRFEVVRLSPAGVERRSARRSGCAARADRFVAHVPRWPPSRRSRRAIRDGCARRARLSRARHGRTSFALAALRLAPLQCAAWGHPVTTGHADDRRRSSPVRRWNRADGDAHYTERLVRLPGIGTRYARPARAGRASRARRSDCPTTRSLLLCPQSLFKIHPDNDALFARVLAATPRARLVDVRGPASGADRDASRAARARARRAEASPRRRVIVLPQCGTTIICASTSPATRCSTRCTGRAATRASTRSPAACRSSRCPGAFMRGRQSAGMLELMALRSWSRPTRTTTCDRGAACRDRAWRDELSARIVAGRRAVRRPRAGRGARALLARRGVRAFNLSAKGALTRRCAAPAPARGRGPG